MSIHLGKNFITVLIPTISNGINEVCGRPFYLV